MLESQDKNIIPIAIEDEVRKSYLNYAMSVIVARALPDVRDGLKPVHRRILYAMHDIGLIPEKSFRKTAHVVGEVIAKYHPHGDVAVYDALVRLAQEFSLRYPLVHGQGNFGSIDGDPPAAMRYTEAKLKAIAQEMLVDIDKKVVKFIDNYDASFQEPQLLPSKLPFLLANGASGIAVGMATNLAPHNLKELCQGFIALIDNPHLTVSELMHYVKGPDFPTGASILGLKGIEDALQHGKGKVVMRAIYKVEENKNRQDLIFTELPYTVNKSYLLMHIAEHVKNKKLNDIAHLRDESNRDGIRIVIELKRTADLNRIINYLFKYTDLQKNFNIHNVVLVNGLPKCLNLKQLMWEFILFRKQITIDRVQYDLKEAQAKAHLLEGLLIALDDLDTVIQIIRQSRDSAEAKVNLLEKYQLSIVQIEAILDMRLHRLTSLEVEKIQAQLSQLKKDIAHYEFILSDDKNIYTVVKEDFISLDHKFGDKRRTTIIPAEAEILDEGDIIPQMSVVIVYSHEGYIKRVPLSEYRAQHRGGKGSSSANLHAQDYVKNIFVSHSHSYILFFSNLGRAYCIKAYEVVESTKQNKGKHIHNLLMLKPEEKILQMVEIKDFSETIMVLLGTQKGQIMRIPLNNFANARRKGIQGIVLAKGDALESVILSEFKQDVLLITQEGYALRLKEDSIRKTSRKSKGVKGIYLRENDNLVSLISLVQETKILIVSENGYSKRLSYDEFLVHGRGTKGQIAYKTNKKTGILVKAVSVLGDDQVVCITNLGKAIKLDTQKISQQKRAAYGIRIFDSGTDKVVDIACANAEIMIEY